MGAVGMAEKVYTVKEVAKIIRASVRTVYRMIQNGEIEYFTVRGDYRITQSALDKVMQKGDTSQRGDDQQT